MRRFFLTFSIFVWALSIKAVAQDKDIFSVPQSAKDKAAELVSKMTLEEKIDYIGGYNGFYIRSIDRLGIPMIRMADGPQGVRNDTQSTMFPSGIAVASTWNRDLVYLMGKGLGEDSRARGVHILLGPGVNIYKMPVAGRNFEYFGEDPYLAGETAAAYIKGVQSQGVMACVKHFAVNSQEWSRHIVSADVDERTLNEIYFPAFEKAVKKSGVGSVMDSYNLVNSVHSTENKYMNIDILRNTWGFDGILMSDWTATYSPICASYGGLDLEMPSAKILNKENLIPLIENGIVDEKVIDEKVQNILQTLIAFGFFDRPQLDRSISERNAFSDSVALEVSRNAIVMLKNDESFLPVKKGKFVVCGPHADMIVTGGGSGFVNPFETKTVAQGMQQMGKSVKTYISSAARSSELSDFYADEKMTNKGAKAEYFANMTLSGAPALTKDVESIDFKFGKGAPAEGLPKDSFSARYTFWCCPAEDVRYDLSLASDDGSRLLIDGKLVLDNWSNHKFRSVQTVVRLEGGMKHKLEVEYYDDSGDARVQFSYINADPTPTDVKAMREADAVIVCLGFDSTNERENYDRTFELPVGQKDYLNEVLKYNENVVVVLNAGGGVEMESWIGKVKAVLMAWYPGQEGGLAISEIITGKISPSGKLPISIEKRLEDNPSYGSYYENTSRVRNGLNPYSRISYNDGIFVGYRGYDKSGVKPLFDFGYGMSYSTFKYSGISAEKNSDGTFAIGFDITNTGKYDAYETAELYVHDNNCSLIRPEKELKGYEKVFLKKGETKHVTIKLDDEAFRMYDVRQHKFVVEPGTFKILVGASSSDIRLTVEVNVD